jgi:excisionase family DNA binding protein
MNGGIHMPPQGTDRPPRMSMRAVAAMLGISHTKVRRILAGQASLPDRIRYEPIVRALLGQGHHDRARAAGQEQQSVREAAPPATPQPSQPFLTVHPEIARALVRSLQDQGAHLVLDVPQLARLLGRHPRTIRRWIRDGLVPATRIGGRYTILLPRVADILAHEGVIPLEAITWLRQHHLQRPLTRRDIGSPRSPAQQKRREARA